ncbi:hypothetical protein MBLNU457_5999t1 [Dothideomycetes sp. NU457]
MKAFLKKKAPAPSPPPPSQPAPQLLSFTLPTDDFRTSLIMPNLSARFSMLREQSPDSKIGKAADDSVIPLNDISEVAFIRDDESIMNRARPGEGNNLFGGRQKVYKIPSSVSTKSLGRPVYEDDIHKSSFQKWRQQEKAENDVGLGIATDEAHNLQTSPASEVSPSEVPPSEVPASEVAQSPEEIGKPLERSLTKRRLYEQTLDQHMHEQQASNLTRLNSIQKRTKVPTQSPQPDDLLSSAIHPTDRGKATAMLAFDKPRQAFDEEQYLKRLQQMASPKVSEESDRSVKLARFDSARHTQDSTIQQRRRSKSLSDVPVFQPESTADTHKTFFGDISASSSDDDEDISTRYNRFPSTLPSVSEHPAMRSQTFPEIREEDEEDVPDQNISQPAPRSDLLRGLIHQHLRKQSDQSSIAPSVFPPQHLRNQSTHSSIYPATLGKDDSAASLTSTIPGFARQTENRIDSTYTNSNPWDLDDFDSSYYYGDHDISHDNGHAEQQNRPDAEPKSVAYQNDLKSQHTRDSSNGTMQEREAFANELAARQKAIQENLRSIVEAESRSGSPQPTFKAFNMLKPKSSRDSIVRQDAPNKAAKMLGLGSTPGSTSALGKYDEDCRPGAERQSSFSSASRGLNSQRTPPIPRPRENSESSLRGRLPQSHPSPTINQDHRSRSNSAASSPRATSRQSRFKDDGANPRSPRLPQHMSSQTSLNGVGQPSSIDIPSRLRSGSRSNTPNIPEALHIQPPQNITRLGPTPSAPVSAPLTTTTRSVLTAPPRPSPVGSSFSTSAIPTTSAISTPASHANFSRPSPSPITTRSGGQLLRKKTISKAEISEPTLISSTSTVDTVDLPPGASLKNGMNEVRTPALPKRSRTQKLFHFGRDSPSNDLASKRANAVSPPPAVPATYAQMKSPDRANFQHEHSSFQRPQPRTMRSNESLDRPPMPAITGSAAPVMTEGGMF